MHKTFYSLKRIKHSSLSLKNSFISVSLLLQGGIYFFQLVDHFAASISIMYLAFFEVIAISWFYGGHRLAKNVREMTGRLPSQYIQFCWWVAAPALLMVSLHSHVREDNIKMNLHEVGCGGGDTD